MTATTAKTTAKNLMTGTEIVMTTRISEAIQKLGRIDEDHIFDAISGRMGRDEFEAIIARLGRAGEVRRDGVVLVWIGG